MGYRVREPAGFGCVMPMRLDEKLLRCTQFRGANEGRKRSFSFRRCTLYLSASDM